MIKIIVDDKEVKTLLNNLSAKVKDMRPVMRQIAGIMKDAVEENFKEEGRPKWTPSKRALIESGKTLQKSGKLAASISSKSDNTSAQVGTNRVYAAIHQFGFKGAVSIKSHIRKVKSRDIRQGRKVIAKGITTVRAHSKTMNIPARPFLRLDTNDIDYIKRAIVNYLKNG